MSRINLSVSFLLVFIFVCTSSGQSLPERYHTYQEVLDTLTILRDTFPEVMRLDTLGYSQRDTIPMLRVKISDNPLVDEDEPAVFFDGGVHADEVLSVEVVLNFIQDIMHRYSEGDPIVLEYIESLEIFVVPFINPEGHMVVEGGDLDWRKNKSDNFPDDGDFNWRDGVDNNRNYDFGWEIDSDVNSNVPESLMFKGYYPFSESENRAMRDYGWQYRPVIALDYHSPTYGRPNVAYYPWYWYSSDGGHGFGPDESLMHSICQEYTSLIPAIPDDSGTVTYTARRALVNKGDFKTYFYGNFGTVAFTVEISDTTIQDTALVDSIVAGHLDSQYFLLERALGPGITGIIRDSITLEPLEAEVQVLEHINADINPRLSRPDYGRYRRILAPGSYTLRFLKEGYATRTINNVVVTNSGPTVTDIKLMPLNPVPPAPELVAPADDETLYTAYVDFEWNAAPYATGYVIEIANDSVFESVCLFDSSLSSTTYQNPEPFDEGRYFWRCTAFNDMGYSERSEVRSFNISSVFYIPGDVNDDGQVMGNDVTYLVRYFKGVGAPPPVEVDGFYPAADANGDCHNLGNDVTYLVAYFKGGDPPIDGHCF